MFIVFSHELTGGGGSLSSWVLNDYWLSQSVNVSKNHCNTGPSNSESGFNAVSSMVEGAGLASQQTLT